MTARHTHNRNEANWDEANRQHLTVAVGRVRTALERHVQPEGRTEERTEERAEGDESPPLLTHAFSLPPALQSLCAEFGLSSFERDTLLLCVGMETDARFPTLCAAAQSGGNTAYPTFGLALKTLPEAHWSALTPAAPLRHWRLLEVSPAETLTSGLLRIDERVLHYLTGIGYLDERLNGLMEPIAPPNGLPVSYRPLAERIVAIWTREQAREQEAWPVLMLEGDARGGKRTLAALACSALGLRLHVLRAGDIPASMGERETLIRLWDREAILCRSALLLEGEPGIAAETTRATLDFVERTQGLLLLTGLDLPRLRGRRIARLEVNRPGAAEQRALWKGALGPLAPHLNGSLDAVISQFSLDVEEINAAGQAMREETPTAMPEQLPTRLWAACRTHMRLSLESLAQRIEPAATWDDLILPETSLHILQDVASHVRQRTKVYDAWGFAERGARGLGISALFAGPSGTGKTMAAEVLAKALNLDLYRIDLSQVVSKYIGETEKNLRSIFDTAEQGGSILLFDEADALFGKRSEVKDSHDRYANIEVSYLLQRMEAYRGLAILTTNQRAALDTAFLRRLRFIITFPFPDPAQRARIWQRIFPPGTPTAGLDYGKLARLNVSGGNIRNIALNAAFLAADAGESVRMVHLLHAAQSECVKLEKPLSEAEIGGWV